MAFDTTKALGRTLSRRRALIWGGMAAAVGSVLAACGGAPSPTAAPAKPTEAPKPAAATATTAPAAKPAEPTKPAAVAPTTAPAAKPTEAAKPGAPTPVPPTATPIAGLQRVKSNAKVTGTMVILVNNDFHPDHNAFVRAEYAEYAKVNGWNVDLSNIAGFQGGGDLNQKLVAGVQAGNAPDMMNHNVGARQLQFLGALEPVGDLVQESIGKHGAVVPGFQNDLEFENNWWAVPFFTRAGGWYIRGDIFKKHGLDPDKDLADFNKARETALKISDPDNKMWGWGMTVNRSGDGNSMVQNVLFRFGSQVQDEKGEIIKFNSPESVAGLNWLKETYSDPKWAKMLPPGVLSWNDLSNNEAFLAGTIAITDNAGTMYAKAVFDKVPHAKDILFVQRPARFSDGKRLEFLSGERFYVIKGTKNKEAAYDMIRHMLSDQVQQQIWKISTAYALPAYKNGWSHDIITSNENSRRALPIAYPADTSWTGLRYPGPATPAMDAIGGGNYFTDMMAEVLQGKKTEDVVKDYHNKFVQIFKEFGLKGA
jgi:multiple sugar transport system substrate-binding protein